MRRIFRDTTALTVALSLVLPSISLAQPVTAQAAAPAGDGPARLILAQAGGNPVVVVPADEGKGRGKAEPEARQKAREKAEQKAGKAQPGAAADPKDGGAEKRAEQQKAERARKAESQDSKAEAKRKAPAEPGRDAAPKAAVTLPAAEAGRTPGADRKLQPGGDEPRKADKADKADKPRKADHDKGDPARKDAETRAKAAAQQDRDKADQPAAARSAEKQPKRQDGEKRDAERRGPAPVVVTPGKGAAADRAPAEAGKADDIARALAERQGKGTGATDGEGKTGPVIVPAQADKASQKAPGKAQAKGKSPDEIARALAERQGRAAPVVIPSGPQNPGRNDAGPDGKGPAADPGKGNSRQADQGQAGAPVIVPGNPGNPGRQDAAQAALAEAQSAARAIPEARARKTDAALEAAAAAAVPAAAALVGGAAPVVVGDKTQVTRENSRDATEDFATDLNGRARRALDDAAAAAAAGKGRVVTGGGDRYRDGSDPVVVGGRDDRGWDSDGRRNDRNDRNDDGNDLEDALKGIVLPALAGMVVGKVLSNNRAVALNTGDRVVVTRGDGSQELIKDDNALLMRPGSTVQNEQFADGSSRTVVTREDGSQVVTIRDADLRVLRRTVIRPDGTTTALIDETAAVRPVDVATLPAPAQPAAVLPGQPVSDLALREALRRETTVGRTFTLSQIRNIPEVRALVAPVDIQSITFDTGSAAIKADQAQSLASLGRVITDSIRENPAEIYLIEGHTDTAGGDATNLALSDRRAESVALALTEFFQVPPENMVVQGYGEAFPKIAREGDVRANRRATVRRITDLLARN